MISLGIPDELDLHTHIAVGNNYEDVEYVKTPKDTRAAEQVIAETK